MVDRDISVTGLGGLLIDRDETHVTAPLAGILHTVLLGDKVLDGDEKVRSQATLPAIDLVEQTIEENLAEKPLGKILGICG